MSESAPDLDSLRALLQQTDDAEAAQLALVTASSDTALPFPLRLRIFDALSDIQDGKAVRPTMERLLSETGLDK